MKKVLFVLMALLVASPAMAAVGTITFGTPTKGVGTVTIPWTSTNEGVVGIGLRVNVTGGTATQAVVQPTAWFNVFLDSAFTIESTGGTYVVGNGYASANQNAAGQLPLTGGQAAFSICVGGLDDDGVGTGTETAPMGGEIVLTGTPGATVVLSEDALRGNVVGYSGAMTIVGLPKTTAFGAAAECFPSTNSTYAAWVQFNRPACWCNVYQCDGDIANDKSSAGYRIYSTDLTILSDNWKKKDSDYPATLNICADIDHKKSSAGYRVYSGDLTILSDNWKKKDSQLPANCPRAE